MRHFLLKCLLYKMESTTHLLICLMFSYRACPIHDNAMLFQKCKLKSPTTEDNSFLLVQRNITTEYKAGHSIAIEKLSDWRNILTHFNDWLFINLATNDRELLVSFDQTSVFKWTNFHINKAKHVTEKSTISTVQNSNSLKRKISTPFT